MAKRKTPERQLIEMLLDVLERDAGSRARRLRRGEGELRQVRRFRPTILRALDRGDVEGALIRLSGCIDAWTRSRQQGHAAQLYDAVMAQASADHRKGQREGRDKKLEKRSELLTDFEAKLAERQRGREPRRDDEVIVRRTMAAEILKEKLRRSPTKREVENKQKALGKQIREERKGEKSDVR